METKKVLFTAKVDSHIRHFHLPFLKLFKNHDYIVDVASEGSEVFENCDSKFDIKFGTNPFSKSIIKSYRELKSIIESNEYDIIHTHTAIASVLTRFIANRVNRKRDFKSRIIYTAHGFHFLKGGSIISWLLYYPIERYFAKMTDDLILINREDYELATKLKMGKNRHLVNGVGIDLRKFKPSNEKKKLEPFVITYVAELSTNKNQIMLIETAKILKENKLDFIVNLVGSGANEEKLRDYIRFNDLSDNVKLLGYRKDVRDILDESSIVAATSRREGLPINIIESMAMGLPLIVTKCRGHVDLVVNGENGFVIDYSPQELYEKILRLKNESTIYTSMSRANIEKAKNYSIDSVLKVMSEIYNL